MPRLRGRRPVYCEELEIEFNSPGEAKKYIKGDSRAIVSCCNGDRDTYHDLHWR